MSWGPNLSSADDQNSVRRKAIRHFNNQNEESLKAKIVNLELIAR
jgi:hypothetical protein